MIICHHIIIHLHKPLWCLLRQAWTGGHWQQKWTVPRKHWIWICCAMYTQLSLELTHKTFSSFIYRMAGTVPLHNTSTSLWRSYRKVFVYNVLISAIRCYIKYNALERLTYIFDRRSDHVDFHHFFSPGDIALFVKPVKASRGEHVVITTDVLLAVDGTERPEELLYVITVPPVHGHMEYIKHTGIPIHSFSQLDIAANLVRYVHDIRATSPRDTVQYGPCLFLWHSYCV